MVTLTVSLCLVLSMCLYKLPKSSQYTGTCVTHLHLSLITAGQRHNPPAEPLWGQHGGSWGCRKGSGGLCGSAHGSGWVRDGLRQLSVRTVGLILGRPHQVLNYLFLGFSLFLVQVKTAASNKRQSNWIDLYEDEGAWHNILINCLTSLELNSENKVVVDSNDNCRVRSVLWLELNTRKHLPFCS